MQFAIISYSTWCLFTILDNNYKSVYNNIEAKNRFQAKLSAAIVSNDSPKVKHGDVKI